MTYRVNTDDCRYCLDGYAPAGIHPLLGPIFIHCLICLTWGDINTCPGCNGQAVFPTDFPDMRECIHQLIAQGVTPIFCEDCDGIIAVLPLTATGGTP
jgi:hypothetical protein